MMDPKCIFDKQYLGYAACGVVEVKFDSGRNSLALLCPRLTWNIYAESAA
ncbi:hypothetical protein [Streptomyces sp. NPDC059371]